MNLLLSFHYYRSRDLVKVAKDLISPRFFVDSGAYTAWTMGSAIDIAEYAAWLRRWLEAGVIQDYANLDALATYNSEATAAATLRNQQELEKKHGLHPIPVFHGGEPMNYLRRYCDQYRYVAIGGMAGHRIGRDVVLRWLAQCFSIAAKTGTRFHGFGQTSVEILRALPWYSADSTSWAAGQRYGRIHVWDYRTSWPRIVPISGKAQGKAYLTFKWAPHIRRLGFDPNVLTDPNQYNWLVGVQLGAATWLEFEQWLQTNRRRMMADKWDGRPIIYLVTSTPHMSRMVRDAYVRWERAHTDKLTLRGKT